MTAKHQRFIFLGIAVLFLLTALVLAIPVPVFHFNETDLVKIKASAMDADNDHITYSYSPPLNERGEWQTDYNDSGEYDVEITVSDGVNQSVRKVKLIIGNKNRPPVVTEKKVTIKETQALDLKEFITDPDNDALRYYFSYPFDKNGVWKTKFGDAGSSLATFWVTDGLDTVEGRMQIVVLTANQPPVLWSYSPTEDLVKIKENQTIQFSTVARDGDGDLLTFAWSMDGKTIGYQSKGEYYFGFESAGEHQLKVVVSDGVKSAGKEWLIQVENTNRAPELHLLPITVKEGEKVTVTGIPEKDVDGDLLAYSFESPLDSEGEWQTNYSDAGTYDLEVTASDSELLGKADLQVTVIDVDQAPVLILPQTLEVKEGSLLSWKVNTYDPDGDEIRLTIEGLPEGAAYLPETSTVIWKPGYDVIQRKSGLLSNILNTLRLEPYFLKEKNFPLKVTSCGKQLCTSGTVNLKVDNVNRPPQLWPLSNMTIKETGTVEFKVGATDPDGDFVRYYFSSPLGKRNGKWSTDYGDKGNYTIWVTATDGRSETTQKLQLEVLKNDRAPSLSVPDDSLTINEGQNLSFAVKATDPDKDNLTISIGNLPKSASFKEGNFQWTPGYDTVKNMTLGWWNNFISRSSFWNKRFSPDKNVLWLSFIASDGVVETVHPVKVTIKNVNRAPELLDYTPTDAEITTKVNQPVIFHVTVKDQDYDPLQYNWDFGFVGGTASGTDTVQRSYTTAGTKNVKVTVSDGRAEVEKQWEVKVEAEEAVAEETNAPNAVPQPAPEPVTESTTEKPSIKVYVING